ITAVVAAAIFLPIVLIGSFPLTILTYLLASIALYALLKMRKVKLFSLPGLTTLILLWIVLIPNQLYGLTFITKVELTLLIILLFLTATVVTKNEFTFDDVSFSIMATIYIGMGFFYFMETREAGLVYIFYSLFIIW